MNIGVILFMIFLIFFFLCVLLIGGIETLNERKKAQKRYIKRLESENQYLKRTVSFLKVALETKGGVK